MAFNAGSIEATLDLNRNPFTQGLRAARAEANRWSRNAIKAEIKPELSQAGLTRVRQQLSRVVGRALINPRLDQDRMRAVKAQIERQVGRITVRPRLDQAAMRTLRERVNSSVGSIKVRARLDLDSFRKLQERIRAANAYIQVKTRLDRDALTDLRAQLRGMEVRARVRIDVDEDGSLAILARQLADIDDQFARTGRSAQTFGNHSSGAFQRADGAARLFIATMPLALPTMAALVQAAIGLGGALTAAFVGGAATLGAFAVVAVPTFNKIADAAKKSREEIAQLPNGIRQAAGALKTLQEQYEALVSRTEANVGLALAEGFNAAAAAVKTLDPLINSMAEVLTRVGREATEYFSSSHWSNFVNFMSKEMIPVWNSFWDIVKYLTRAIMDLSVAFTPMAQWLLAAIADGMREFAEWASTLAGDPAFHKWVEDAKEGLRAFWDFLVSVVNFLFKLANALAPVGVVVMDMLTGLFNALSKMPPEWLSGIAGGLSAIMAALLFGASPPVAAVVGVIAGVAFALITLYNNSEKVRGIVQDLVDYLRANFLPIWQRLKDQFERDVLPVLVRIKDTFINDVIPAFADFMRAIQPFVNFITEFLGVAAIQIIEKLAIVFDYTLKEIGSMFRFWAAVFTGDWEGAWEEIKHSFDLKLQLIQDLFGGMWESFLGFLASEGEKIKTGWNNLWEETKRKADEIWEGFKTGWTAVLNWIEDELGLKRGTIETAWNDFWTGLKEDADPIIEELKKGWADYWAFLNVKQNEESLKSTLSWGVWLVGLLQQASEYWELLKLGWQAYWTDSQATQDQGESNSDISWIQWLANLLTGFANWRTNLIANALGAWNDFTASLQSFIGDVQGRWDGFWGALNSAAVGWWGQIQGGWDGMLGNMLSAAIDIWNQIRGAFDNGVAAVRGAVNGMIDGVNGVFGFFGIPGIPRLASGGVLGDQPGGLVPGFAAGGQLFDPVGGGFKTNGPRAIVGEGNPRYPEYVIPTDPQYRDRASKLYNSLGNDLTMMASGGILGTGLPSLNFPSLPSLDSVLGAMASHASGPWLGIAQGVARKIWDAVTAKVNAAIQAALAAVANAIGSIGGGGGAPVSGSVVEQVRQVAARFGWGSGAEWAALSRLIQKESSWNPNAANPTSSARGLFQKMTSIHGPVEGSAGGQASWGLNYIRGRYGSPSAALAFHNRNNWYDNGGFLPPGLSMAFNGTGKPEAVLTDEQWKALAGGQQVVVENEMPPGAPSMEKLNSTMESVRELLEKRGAGATVNINGAGQSAPEVARAAVLQLHLNR